MAKKKREEVSVVADHPSQEAVDRFPTDQLLRRNGFQIHARPRRGEAIWKRRDEQGEQLFPQRKALKLIANREEK